MKPVLAYALASLLCAFVTGTPAVERPRQRASLADGIKTANQHLVATHDGAAIAEISTLLDRITRQREKRGGAGGGVPLKRGSGREAAGHRRLPRLANGIADGRPASPLCQRLR